MWLVEGFRSQMKRVRSRNKEFRYSIRGGRQIRAAEYRRQPARVQPLKPAVRESLQLGLLEPQRQPALLPVHRSLLATGTAPVDLARRVRIHLPASVPALK